MARLRAMRRGRRRKGGMFKGVTHAQLTQLVADAERKGENLFNVVDANRVDHVLSVESAKKC